ncbi:MAG TPA: helix-turn-helix transcriptional regulator [Mycobacteriales bacterium]
MADASPTIRRRELGTRLRALRSAANLTVEEVAARIEVSAAKVSRIETAARGVNINDIRALCDAYQVSAAERDRLLTLARESRRRSWWQEYGLPESAATYIGLEDAATSILQYSSSLIPPLLQTEGYARAVTSGIAPWLPDEEIEQFVRARLARQALLESASPPEVWAIVDEAVLHRPVGGGAVMRAQLGALLERSRPANVTLQVIALEAGAHPGMDSAFILLQLEEVSDVVYVEGLIGNLYLQNQKDLGRYRRAFDHLQAVALSPAASRERIRAAASSLPDS